MCLLYSSELGNAPEPARQALRLLEDVVAKTGGDGALAIAAWPGLRRLETGPALWKDLGIAYDVLARVDGQDPTRVVLAYQRFVERAAADDPTCREYAGFLKKQPRRTWGPSSGGAWPRSEPIQRSSPMD